MAPQRRAPLHPAHGRTHRHRHTLPCPARVHAPLTRRARLSGPRTRGRGAALSRAGRHRLRGGRATGPGASPCSRSVFLTQRTPRAGVSEHTHLRTLSVAAFVHLLRLRHAAGPRRRLHTETVGGEAGPRLTQEVTVQGRAVARTQIPGSWFYSRSLGDNNWESNQHFSHQGKRHSCSISRAVAATPLSCLHVAVDAAPRPAGLKAAERGGRLPLPVLSARHTRCSAAAAAERGWGAGVPVPPGPG